MMINDLKKRVGKAKGRCAEELSKTLWAYRCSTTGKSRYNLTYGTNVMLPIEVGEPTIQKRLNDLDINNTNLKINLNLLEEL